MPPAINSYQTEEELGTENFSLRVQLEVEITQKKGKVLPQEKFANKVLLKEFALYKVSRKKAASLQLLESNLCTIQPTSVDSEPAFSACGLFITKLKGRL